MRRLTGLDNIIGHSAKVRAIFDLILTVAPQSSRVLITGESGTGKELVARAIHENSPRSQAPFITVDCGAFPETLLESELFGYMKGAFTGANENRRGLFQAAHGGTLLLDEIGNMSPAMQVKLYRVLQEGKVRPLGSTEEADVDVRVIAATNRDLEKAIAAGEFREDLFYRLSVIPIHVPPLRERREDIPLMVRAFLDRFRKSMGKPVDGVDPAAMAKLESYDWPGNVRELENTMERSVALETGGLDFGGCASGKNSLWASRRDAGERRIASCFAQRPAEDSRGRVRPRAAHAGNRARLHPRCSGSFRRCGNAGGGTSQDVLPVVSSLRQEIQHHLSGPALRANSEERLAWGARRRLWRSSSGSSAGRLPRTCDRRWATA